MVVRGLMCALCLSTVTPVTLVRLAGRSDWRRGRARLRHLCAQPRPRGRPWSGLRGANDEAL